MLLKKSYMTILKDPASFKKGLFRIIRDIDERLKRLETGEILTGVFSKINHNHDLQYAPLNHNHDDKYSDKGHTHNEYLTENDTINNARHLNNKSDTDFALKSHVHDAVCYMAVFSVNDTNGVFPVETKQNLSSLNNVLFFENYFTPVSIDNNHVIIQYDIPEDRVNTLFHMMYWVENSIDGLKDSNINVNDVTGNIGEDITLYSVVTDNNNAPVNRGQVNYKVN